MTAYAITKFLYDYELHEDGELLCYVENFDSVISIVKYIFDNILSVYDQLKCEDYYFAEYTIYKTHGLNSGLVSYDLLKSSRFPKLELCIGLKTKSYRYLLSLEGDNHMKEILLEKIDGLKDFLDYAKLINSKDHKALKDICRESGLIISLFSCKSKIIRLLLLNKLKKIQS